MVMATSVCVNAVVVVDSVNRSVSVEALAVVVTV
jgi:hypothetical protein